jgi:uncharacterized membrane protein
MYTFNVAIVPALRVMRPKEHIVAMQAINIKIVNPIFLFSFLGPAIILPLAAILHNGSVQFPWLVGAAILHIVGIDGVTVAGNIPLNKKLDAVDASQLTDAEAERIRQDFQGRGSMWMRYHNIRTISGIIATVLILIACLTKMASE